MSRSRLLHLLDRLEKEQQDLLRELDALPAELLVQRPSDGGWSVAQVITHLALVEEGAVAYLRKKLEVSKHGPVDIWSRLRLFVLNTGIRLPVKYKAPGVVGVVPATSYSEARERWVRAREDVRTAYAALMPELLGHDLFKHPLLGRFTPVQALSFLRAHARRHHGQVTRTLRALG